MAWEKIKEMFPRGIPENLNGPRDFESYQNPCPNCDGEFIAEICFPVISYARNMISKMDDIHLTKDNETYFEHKYNVYQQDFYPDGISALSVYGAKMLNDHIEKTYNRGGQNNDGYYYSGI